MNMYPLSNQAEQDTQTTKTQTTFKNTFLFLLLSCPPAQATTAPSPSSPPSSPPASARVRHGFHLRRGQRRFPRSPVRQDSVHQLRLGLRRETRPRPGGRVFCLRGADCLSNSTSSLLPLSSVPAGCSGNCSGDADLLVSLTRAHPPLLTPLSGPSHARNIHWHVSRKGSTTRNACKTVTPESKRQGGSGGGGSDDFLT